jgi:hypothetical protein
LQLGPFIDSEHPDIKKGTVDRDFDEIFHFEVLKKVITLIGFVFGIFFCCPFLNPNLHPGALTVPSWKIM